MPLIARAVCGYGSLRGDHKFSIHNKASQPFLPLRWQVPLEPQIFQFLELNPLDVPGISPGNPLEIQGKFSKLPQLRGAAGAAKSRVQCTIASDSTITNNHMKRDLE